MWLKGRNCYTVRVFFIACSSLWMRRAIRINIDRRNKDGDIWRKPWKPGRDVNFFSKSIHLFVVLHSRFASLLSNVNYLYFVASIFIVDAGNGLPQCPFHASFQKKNFIWLTAPAPYLSAALMKDIIAIFKLNSSL